MTNELIKLFELICDEYYPRDPKTGRHYLPEPPLVPDFATLKKSKHSGNWIKPVTRDE